MADRTSAQVRTIGAGTGASVGAVVGTFWLALLRKAGGGRSEGWVEFIGRGGTAGILFGALCGLAASRAILRKSRSGASAGKIELASCLIAPVPVVPFMLLFFVMAPEIWGVLAMPLLSFAAFGSVLARAVIALGLVHVEPDRYGSD